MHGVDVILGLMLLESWRAPLHCHHRRSVEMSFSVRMARDRHSSLWFSELLPN
jgi:hypothetical protein